MNSIELYDTTPRDGEQAAGASFGLEGRVELFQALDEFGIDYVELGWPVASEDIFKSFALARKVQKNAKIAAFGSTSIASNPGGDENLASIVESKPDVACIFGKTWLEHVDRQLKLTPEGNLNRIAESVSFLISRRLPVFYDAEHFFDGFKADRDYALRTLTAASKAGAQRLILCDTNGGTLTDEVISIVKETRRILNENRIETPLGTHFHNDSGVAVANALATVTYVAQVQGTI